MSEIGRREPDSQRPRHARLSCFFLVLFAPCILFASPFLSTGCPPPFLSFILFYPTFVLSLLLTLLSSLPPSGCSPAPGNRPKPEAPSRLSSAGPSANTRRDGIGQYDGIHSLILPLLSRSKVAFLLSFFLFSELITCTR